MAVSTEILVDGPRHAVLKFTNDGATDESAAAVVKVDASALQGAPSIVKIEKIKADVMPTSSLVHIRYAGATAGYAWMANSHTDVKEFCEDGPLPNNAITPTGDITFQTNAANTFYSIILHVIKG